MVARHFILIPARYRSPPHYLISQLPDPDADLPTNPKHFCNFVDRMDHYLRISFRLPIAPDIGSRQGVAPLLLTGEAEADREPRCAVCQNPMPHGV